MPMNMDWLFPSLRDWVYNPTSLTMALALRIPNDESSLKCHRILGLFMIFEGSKTKSSMVKYTDRLSNSVPSGKHTKNYGKSSFLMGKFSIHFTWPFSIAM